MPDPNTKTGLAGVRSKVYTETWRDDVILPALRIFRARTEGASLDTIPEVTYSQKPRCDQESYSAQEAERLDGSGCCEADAQMSY